MSESNYAINSIHRILYSEASESSYVGSGGDIRLYSFSKDIPSRLPTNGQARELYGRRIASVYTGIDDILNQNVKYNESIDTWESYYVFPEQCSIKEYLTEDHVGDREIVNRNRETVRLFADDAIEMCSQRYDGGKIMFLTGTTGVGKTTFLKYFSRTNKKILEGEGILEVRIKYRELENRFEREPEISVQEHLERLIVDQLFLEAVDRLIEVIDTDSYSEEFEFALIDGSTTTVAEASVALGKSKERIGSMLPYNVSTRSEDNGTRGYLSRAEARSMKTSYMRKLSAGGIKFLVSLDGFDALNPEDILLFEDDPEGEHARAFLVCLRGILSRKYSQSLEGELLRSVDVSYILALRMVTETQIKHLQFETESARTRSYHVVGTDIFPLLKNRLVHCYSKDVLADADQEIYDAIVAGTRKLVQEVCRNYEGIQTNRLIDLFNHNIRDKLRFLSSAIQVLIDSVQFQYRIDRGGKGRSYEKMGVSTFISYLKEGKYDIKFHKIERALLLGNQGKFQNWFKYDLHGKLEQAFDRGSFDNILNYECSEIYGNPDGGRPASYQLARDPILLKYLIMKNIMDEAGGEIEWKTLKDRFEDSYEHYRVEGISLKVLIRSGYIFPRQNGTNVWLSCTPKGKFCMNDLVRSQVYMEHAVLCCLLPLFALAKVGVETHRWEWGQASIANVTALIRHLSLAYHNCFKVVTSTNWRERDVLIKSFFEDGIRTQMSRMIKEGGNRNPIYQDQIVAVLEKNFPEAFDSEVLENR